MINPRKRFIFLNCNISVGKNQWQNQKKNMTKRSSGKASGNSGQTGIKPVPRGIECNENHKTAKPGDGQ